MISREESQAREFEYNRLVNSVLMQMKDEGYVVSKEDAYGKVSYLVRTPEGKTHIVDNIVDYYMAT